MNEEEDSKWRRRFERERAGRKEAEALLEDKSRDLYHANRSLEQHARELESLVSERTSRLAANQKGLVVLNRALIQLGLDTTENLDKLVRTCGEILRADLVVYSRLDDKGRLPIVHHWSSIGDLAMRDDCPVCHQVFEIPQDELLVLENLPKYLGSQGMDVEEVAFQSYAGYGVNRGGKRIGVIGAFFGQAVMLDPFREQVMEMIATAVAMEEDRGLTRRELEAQEHRFAAVFEGSIDGILLHDTAGNLFEANRRAEEMLGRDRDLLRKMNLRDLHPVKWFDLCGEALDRVMSDGAYRFEAEFQRKDASVFLAEISASRFQVGGETWIQAILRDITEKRRLDNERREAAAELARAKAEAERANAAKSLFLANMSHEIRTPMNGIIGFTEMLAETSLDERQRDYLGTIRASGEVLLSIINDILDLSRIEEGRLEMDPTIFDPARCIRESVGILQARADAKNLKLEVEIGPDAPATIETDRDRLCQVLLNLINNAIKFTPAGRIAVRLGRDNGPGQPSRAVFEVEDTGVGITPADQEMLFRPFNQVGEAGARRQGTGLGLAICKSLVEAMGGQISCESEPGRGSCFRFDLPDGLRSTDIRPRTAAILLSNPVQRGLLGALLGRRGHTVSLAATGDAVLEQWRDSALDFLISDRVNWETIPFADDEERNAVPVILAVSDDALDGSQVPADWRSRGIRCVLPFPVDPDKLDTVIDAMP